MVAPSRTTSPGVSLGNPHDINTDNAGITEYELLRDKRKEKLHAKVQKALLSNGFLIDERVLQGFDGTLQPERESTAENNPSC
jgi:hypothetical protein